MMSKILEKLALRRLKPHVMSTGNFIEYQSAYRVGHSTEIALLKVVNDVVMSACGRLIAFDTIDHSILIDRSSRTFGIRSTARSWLQSFISDRKQYVPVVTEQSEPASCTSGVPQASVLSPLLFAMYPYVRWYDVVAAHSLCYHEFAYHHYEYADDSIRSYTWPFDRVLT